VFLFDQVETPEQPVGKCADQRPPVFQQKHELPFQGIGSSAYRHQQELNNILTTGKTAFGHGVQYGNLVKILVEVGDDFGVAGFLLECVVAKQLQ
jgi:hypothetical protein